MINNPQPLLTTITIVQPSTIRHHKPRITNYLVPTTISDCKPFCTVINIYLPAMFSHY